MLSCRRPSGRPLRGTFNVSTTVKGLLQCVCVCVCAQWDNGMAA